MDYIFALFDNPQHIDSLLSNLEEADIATQHVSIIASDAKVVDELSAHKGPFSGTEEVFSRMKNSLDISQQDEDNYLEKVKAGNTLVIIPANDTLVPTILEMIKDSSASESKVISSLAKSVKRKA